MPSFSWGHLFLYTPLGIIYRSQSVRGSACLSSHFLTLIAPQFVMNPTRSGTCLPELSRSLSITYTLSPMIVQALTRKKREAVFQPEFIEDLRYWVEVDLKSALRVLRLVEDVLRDPFQGIGKLEQLKYLAPGMWSRRITQEQRLVYLVRDERIDFLQARYFY